MSKDELNNCVIDTRKRESEWFYHGLNTSYKIEEDFINIFENGLLCPFLRHTDSGGYNGKFYISLSKCVEGISEYDSSYLSISTNNIGFIIDGIKPIKTKHYKDASILEKLLSLRVSGYYDEYQQFLKVEPVNFVGVQMSLDTIQRSLENNPTYLRFLSDILKYLISIESTMPFYGFDDPFGDLYLLDKPKTYELIDSSISRIEDRI